MHIVSVNLLGYSHREFHFLSIIISIFIDSQSWYTTHPIFRSYLWILIDIYFYDSCCITYIFFHRIEHWGLYLTWLAPCCEKIYQTGLSDSINSWNFFDIILFFIYMHINTSKIIPKDILSVFIIFFQNCFIYFSD